MQKYTCKPQKQWLSRKCSELVPVMVSGHGEVSNYRAPSSQNWETNDTRKGPFNKKAECSLVHSVLDGQSGHTDLRPASTPMSTRLEALFLSTLPERPTVSRTQCFQCRTGYLPLCKFKSNTSQVCWHTPVIPALNEARAGRDLKLEVNLSGITRSCLSY